MLLAVRAAGLDRGTWHLMEGKPRLLRLAFGLRTPKQPVIGRDVAGTVVEVGSDCERLALLLESGELVPSLDRAYPMAEAADAMRHLESGAVRGRFGRA